MNAKRSKYGEHFVVSGELAECKKCQANVVFTKSSGTNNLRFHLEKYHKDLWIEMNNAENESKKKKLHDIEVMKKQAMIPFPTVSKVKTTVSRDSPKMPIIALDNEKRNESINMAIIQFIAMDNHAIRIVEQAGFQNLLSVISPRFRLSSRKVMTDVHLPKLKHFLEEKIKESISHAKTFGITSDGWTSKDGKHSLLSVTAHWVEESDFTPKYAVIGSCCVKGRHTAANFIQLIDQTLNRFEISRNQITCCIRDGASTMSAMCERMQVESIHCYAHNLQLAVQDVIGVYASFPTLLEKLKKIVRKIHKSTIAKDLFKTLQDEKNLPSRMLIKETVVRWSSLFLMLSSFIDNKNAVTELISRDAMLPFISENDWEDVTRVQQVLQPLAEMTKALQSRFDSPLSVIIPSLRMLDCYFDKLKTKFPTDEKLLKLIEKLQEAINCRTSKYHHNKLLKTASFVDPRYKDSFFHTSHKDQIIEILSKDRESPISSKDASGNSQTDDLDEEESVYEKLVRESRENTPDVEELSDIEREVTNYLKLSPSSSTEPFAYWKGCRDFPNLRQLAVQMLGIPATSSESERCFSVAGMITTPRRSNLNPETLESLTFCSLNLKILGFNNSW